VGVTLDLLHVVGNQTMKATIEAKRAILFLHLLPEIVIYTDKEIKHADSKNASCNLSQKNLSADITNLEIQLLIPLSAAPRRS
jgi:hypothetical protein